MYLDAWLIDCVICKPLNIPVGYIPLPIGLVWAVLVAPA